ncbi:MAG: acyl-CoA thioesterase [Planctomycetes bacterium]|nr:acyl-CoA thioesterase [Planctomycetota bacterium]
MTKTDVTYRTQRRVEFRDTDMAGIVHFSAFLVYMEEAEHEFLRSRGLSVISSDEHGAIHWPRVSANCDFRGPVRFEDLLEVTLSISRLGEKSITYATQFLLRGVIVAEGSHTVVCCRDDQTGGFHSAPIPDWYRARLVGPPAPAASA